MRDLWLRGLAANPAAPADVLVRLLYPSAAAAWPVLCAQRPLPQPVVDAVMRHPEGQPRSLLADNPHVPASQWAHAPVDERGLKRLARNPRELLRGKLLPDAALRYLLDRDRPEIFEELVYSAHARRTYELAAVHPKPYARTWACRFWTSLSDQARAALREDPDAGVRAAALSAHTRHTTALEVDDLPDRHDPAYHDAIMNRRLSTAVVARALAGGDPSDLHMLAYNPSTPPEAVARLARHPSSSIRAQLAARTDLDPELIGLLAADPDIEVRLVLSRHHPQTPAEALLRTFLEDPGPHRWPLTAHPNFPVTGLARFGQHGDPQVRRLATLDPQADPLLIERLTFDNDPDVRDAAAACPRLPADRLAFLLEDEDLAQAAATNTALSSARMHELLDQAGVPATRSPVVR
ncbi:hypothetical protein QEZ54_10035 [Catellatospora sp. KI3]|uniref:hypothetical protein n=1 Tax=Catellatospora sp. KI3 TaxID=3041620 RepID=UPI002483068F|nr:hypothetical protein [Catellatospora sp. KI3]MDI1461306.1 hypothetical protein [Catellatospora sp. KI3]